MLNITLPGSKSYTNRALVIASLANGKSVLKNPLFSDDTHYMVEALKILGIRIEKKKNDLIIYGQKGIFKPLASEIFVGLAGTTMRFLTSLLTLIPTPITITGEKRMLERPIDPLVDTLKKIKIDIKYLKNIGYPPLLVNGKNFPGGKISIRGDISSQYISSILMVAPYAQKDTLIQLSSKLTSKPYIDLTLDIMKSFGIKVKNQDYQSFSIPSDQVYQPQTYTVEPDASSASYFLAAAALTNTPLKISHLGKKSVQGDINFINVIKKLGYTVKKTNNSLGILKGKLKIKDRIIDMNAIPDMVQTLAMLSAVIPARTKIINIGNLRIKETDRIQALENELKKLGIKTLSTKDSLTIIGKGIKELNQHKVEIKTYNDHRMAMSFAILKLLLPNIKILNPECVSKSFPSFWEDFSIFNKGK